MATDATADHLRLITYEITVQPSVVYLQEIQEGLLVVEAVCEQVEVDAQLVPLLHQAQTTGFRRKTPMSHRSLSPVWKTTCPSTKSARISLNTVSFVR